MEICDLSTNFKFVTIKNLYLEKNSQRDFNRERMSGEGSVLLAPEMTDCHLAQNHRKAASISWFRSIRCPASILLPKGPPQASRDKATEEGCPCVLIVKVLF